MPDSQWHPLQWLQSPPHDDLPLFLSLTIPFMISPTIKTKIAPTINVPINDTSCLYHYHTHIITILQSDNQQSTNCEDTECYCSLRSQRHASRCKRYETVAILFIRTRTTRWDAGSDLITVLSGFCHTLYLYIKAAAFLIRSEQQI